MNMLSKIISGKEAKKLQIEKFKIPSPKEIENIIEEKKRETQRTEAETGLLKIQVEKELSTRLEKEYQEKLPQQVKQIRQNYLNSLEELTTLKQTIYNQLENRLMDLVFSISRKVIGTEIKTAPHIILSMLKKGFEKIKNATEYEIKINPADYETVIDKKDDIKEILETPGSIKFTKDEHIERGGCRIITEQGEISSEPGKQLDIIRSELSLSGLREAAP